MINLKPWQEIKVNNKIAYFQFFARSQGEDYIVVTFEPRTEGKKFYNYIKVTKENIEYI